MRLQLEVGSWLLVVADDATAPTWTRLHLSAPGRVHSLGAEAWPQLSSRLLGLLDGTRPSLLLSERHHRIYVTVEDGQQSWLIQDRDGALVAELTLTRADVDRWRSQIMDVR